MATSTTSTKKTSKAPEAASTLAETLSNAATRGARDAFYIAVGFTTMGVARGITAGQQLAGTVVEHGQQYRDRAEAARTEQARALAGYRADLQDATVEVRAVLEPFTLRLRDVQDDVVRNVEYQVRAVSERVGELLHVGD